MSDLGFLLCGSKNIEGIAKTSLDQLSKSIDAFSSRAIRFLNDATSEEAVAFGPFCARVLLENGCAALVGRLDSFRLMYLSEFQTQPDYEHGKRAKSAFSWTGDVIPDDKAAQHLWNIDQELPKISRALFSKHVDHVYWKPAVDKMLDFVATSKNPILTDILEFEAETYINQTKGRSLQLYSTLSKGVHWEFFTSALVFDESTVQNLIRDTCLLVGHLGLTSHFIPTAYASSFPRRSFGSVFAASKGDSMTVHQEDDDSGLVLAAEECPPEKFSQIHNFSSHDEVIIRKLSAHGPVLVRGGRGSGKSALLLEAYHRMQKSQSVFPVYVSLRYLPLLQSDGDEYIGHFCVILSKVIQKEIVDRELSYDFSNAPDQVSLQLGLSELAQAMDMRLVLLFDDAAHIGREKSLEVFFDLFRTLSSNLVSCKASIYPGVTKFGVRFDVFNDSTVIDISRSDVSADAGFFPDVVRARYPALADRATFSDRLSPAVFANLLGRAVVGNLRGFILACNRFHGEERIGIPELTKCFLAMATDYYWPLMEEVAPKLGIYEPLIDPAREVIETIVGHASRSVTRTRSVAPDRVLIHRKIVGEYGKIFEILEYLGFIARREASRAMKSGGRGPVFALNLCNLLDSVSTPRLTMDMVDEWISGTPEPSEIHVSGQILINIKLPMLDEGKSLAIMRRPVDVLRKSQTYPYGLTDDMIGRLQEAGIDTVERLANASDHELDGIQYIGAAKIKRIRDVVYQAIWM